MGFRKVTDVDLKTKPNENFLGTLIKHMGKLLSEKGIEQRQTSTSRRKYSEVVINNEEVLDVQYEENRKIKSFNGHGIITILNNSARDRIWDSRLQFSGTESCSLESENDVQLGIFEPKTSRSIRYNVSELEDLLDLIKIQEDIEILNNLGSNSNLLDEDFATNDIKKNKLLIIGQENEIKILITIENKSESDIENLKLKKEFSNNFYDLDVKTKSNKEVDISNNLIEWTLNRLRPGEVRQLTIIVKAFPKHKDVIRTGQLNVSFTLKDHVISGTKINDFSAHTHAMHAINKTELEDTAGHWVCVLVFENHSTFLLELNSILVLDKSKSNKILNLDFNASADKTHVRPGGAYITDDWEVMEDTDPKFSRKIDYTVFYIVNKRTNINMEFEDDVFDIIGVEIDKKLSTQEIKSFEKSIINSTINIKNISNVPIDKILIREEIPEDFLPLMDLSDYNLKNASGAIKLKDLNLNLIPNDENPSNKHILEITINFSEFQNKAAIGLDQFLEIEYPLRAITPDHNKNYAFPIEIESHYNVNKDQAVEGTKNSNMKIDKLKEEVVPTIKVTHERRKLSIGKQILSGRTNDEFSINIFVVNKSNIKLHDLDISDTFPESFQFVSSNIKNKITKNDKEKTSTIAFAVDSILPLEEKEIIYYLKDINGKGNSYSELESFFYG